MKDSYDHMDKFNRSQQLSQLDHRIDDSMSAADNDGAITNLESHRTIGKQTPGGVEMGGPGSISQNMR